MAFSIQDMTIKYLHCDQCGTWISVTFVQTKLGGTLPGGCPVCNLIKSGSIETQGISLPPIATKPPPPTEIAPPVEPV